MLEFAVEQANSCFFDWKYIVFFVWDRQKYFALKHIRLMNHFLSSATGPMREVSFRRGFEIRHTVYSTVLRNKQMSKICWTPLLQGEAERYLRHPSAVAASHVRYQQNFALLLARCVRRRYSHLLRIVPFWLPLSGRLAGRSSLNVQNAGFVVWLGCFKIYLPVGGGKPAPMSL